MKKNSFVLGALLSVASALTATGANPYLPLWEYIPDSEPYVFEDPDHPGQYRVYVYGSHDTLESAYCGLEQVVWSAPVDDLESWRYDGVILVVDKDRDGNTLNDDGRADLLYAPDVAEVINADGTKTYYLFPNDQHGGRNGLIAKSDRPDGPFEVCNWSADNPRETTGVYRFDPGVLVDDDGRVYGYWGFEHSFMAEIDPATMCTVKDGTDVLEDIINPFTEPGEFRFFEASSMRKIKDKYVFIYSRMTADGDFGLPTSNYTLAYAYSDNPLGPWTYGGTIIDGRGRRVLDDGTTIFTAHPNGNTHGSICQIGDQWYVFYHRQCGLDEYSRQAMVAPITVEVEEGPGGKVYISEAEYTSEGFELDGLNPNKVYPAGIACHYTGYKPAEHNWPNKTFFGSYPEPRRYYGDPAKAPSDIDLTINPVVNNMDGSVVGYKYYNFDLADGVPTQLVLTLNNRGESANIDIIVGDIYDADNAIVAGNIALTPEDHTGVITKVATLSGIDSVKGKQPVYLRFSSDVKEKELAELYWLQMQ